MQALSAPLPLPEASGHARTLVQPKGIVVVGASTGGPRAVRRLLGSYGPETWTMAVAQHMPPQFTTEFAARLARKTGRLVEEAVQGRKMAAGGISVAPGGFQMEITMDGVWPVTRLSSPAPTDRYAPSVDKLFVSAAKAMGANVIALVLTGMGNDGLAGAAAVKQAAGRSLTGPPGGRQAVPFRGGVQSVLHQFPAVRRRSRPEHAAHAALIRLRQIALREDRRRAGDGHSLQMIGKAMPSSATPTKASPTMRVWATSTGQRESQITASAARRKRDATTAKRIWLAR